MIDRKIHEFAIVNMFRREQPHTTLGDYQLVFDLTGYKTSTLIKVMRQSNDYVVSATGRESVTAFDDWCPIIISKAVSEQYFNGSEIPDDLLPVIIGRPWREMRRLRSKEVLVTQSTMNIGPLRFWWCMKLQDEDHYYETPRLNVRLLEKETG